MNSSLLVAPDEQISIAVLTAGNGSSQYAGLMASALMDVALAEQGKAVSDLTPPEPEITDILIGIFDWQKAAVKRDLCIA